VSVNVSCPACGAQISFKVGSAIVAVCPYCNSVVARSDRGVENLGRVADLVETESPLMLGLTGRYDNVPFELTGRAQLGHEAGGLWDEWYAAFANGRWGWLAEAQGRFYLTFRHEAQAGLVPSFDQLRLGQLLQLPSTRDMFKVAEKGTARALAAAGEIPYRLEPNATYNYADLSAPGGKFATLDYSEKAPLIFTGQEVSLNDLGIPVTARRPEQEVRRVEGVKLSCPHCGGALALRAPDRTERVTCPNCGALLDVVGNELRFLQALQQGRIHPIIPLGSVGTFRDTPFTLIGFLKRSVTVQHIKYFWEEYLLYHPRAGFRWLVRSANHWSFVESVTSGDVSASNRGALYKSTDFKLFQKDLATVEHVEGEFYWKVALGEQVMASDFIAPPLMLSREQSGHGDHGEINWSLGTFLPVSEVERAFQVKDLPRPEPFSVAPNQPFPYKRIYRYWALLAGLTFLVGMFVLIAAPHRKVFDQTFNLQSLPTNADGSKVAFSDPFELRGRHNVEATAHANLSNSWLDIEGDLIDEDTGMVQAFSLPIEYYSGIDDGESWSEGSNDKTVYLSAPTAGKYTLRLEFQADKKSFPPQVHVQLVQGVPHVLHWLLALLVVSLIPLVVFAYHCYFEVRRWQDSDYSPFHTS
jgi:hypothetical protein